MTVKSGACGLLAWLVFLTSETIAAPPAMPIGGNSPAVLAPAPAESVRSRTFRYQSRGSVRLLLFWVSKDRVGGGWIRLSETSEQDQILRKITLLFGSDPERVPRGVNRWGYAEEQSVWDETLPEPADRLKLTRFTGLLGKSEEQSASSFSENPAASGSTALFDIAVALIEPLASRSEMRHLGLPADLTYKTAEEAIHDSRRTLAEIAPSEVRVLDNQGFSQYRQPLGFLTAVSLLVDQALDSMEAGLSTGRLSGTKLHYLHNSRVYELKIQKARMHSKVQEGADKWERILELQMSTWNRETDSRHNFELWLPTTGPYRGIPLRIVDKPRWWLKVELILDTAPIPD